MNKIKKDYMENVDEKYIQEYVNQSVSGRNTEKRHMIVNIAAIAAAVVVLITSVLVINLNKKTPQSSQNGQAGQTTAEVEVQKFTEDELVSALYCYLIKHEQNALYELIDGFGTDYVTINGVKYIGWDNGMLLSEVGTDSKYVGHCNPNSSGYDSDEIIYSSTVEGNMYVKYVEGVPDEAYVKMDNGNVIAFKELERVDSLLKDKYNPVKDESYEWINGTFYQLKNGSNIIIINDTEPIVLKDESVLGDLSEFKDKMVISVCVGPIQETYPCQAVAYGAIAMGESHQSTEELAIIDNLEEMGW